MEPAIRLAWARVDAADQRREVAWSLVHRLILPGATLTNTCRRCGGAHGALRIDGSPHVASVSYATRRGAAQAIAVVAVAHTDEVAHLGVDAEFASDPVRETAGGIDDLRTWIRTEAALKADGRGLQVDPASVVLSPSLGSADWTAEVPRSGHEPATTIRGRDVDGPHGVLVCAAWR